VDINAKGHTIRIQKSRSAFWDTNLLGAAMYAKDRKQVQSGKRDNYRFELLA
jgi:hypothetical protein